MPAGRCRCSSCSTSSSTAPIRTTAASAPSLCFAGLIERGAIGLITTHDLALAEIVTGIGPSAVNVHFEDHFEDGQMRFDYRMRPGVVEHSNALELMRAVGLLHTRE